MSAGALAAHLGMGVTEVCRAWAVTRKDGVVLGFADHDRDLSFDGMTFAAASGMTARALEQTTGLAVDNTEALGALSDPSIRESDIRAGLFDGAEVRIWEVVWSDVDARRLIFRGSLGEIERSGASFRAELRGLAEALNQPGGRVYQKPCSAVLGDARCRFDLSQPGYVLETEVVGLEGGNTLVVSAASSFADGWFARGRLVILDGEAVGSIGIVRRDVSDDAGRRIEMWEAPGGTVAIGDTVRLEAGCDKRAETCRVKFDNFLNYQGFPDIPGEDWLMAYPRKSGVNTGGSRR